MLHGLMVLAVAGVFATCWAESQGDARVSFYGNRWLIFHTATHQVVYRGPPREGRLRVFVYGNLFPIVRSMCGGYIALWLIALLQIELRRTLRHEFQLRRAWAGLCPTCGYDLHESPVRCPECGTPVGKDAAE